MATDNRTSAEKMAPTNSQSGGAYQAQQDAILVANQQRQLAEQRAANAAFNAAKNRPAGENDVTTPIPGLKVQYTSLPPTSGSNSRARKGK